MKKKILFIAAAFVLSLASCQKELSPAEENGNANTSTCITFTARFDATKTGFSEGKLTWEAGDKIAVCDGSTVETVTLTAENIKDEGVSAEITTTTLSDAAGKYYAVFPAGCAGSTAGYFFQDGKIEVNIGNGIDGTFRSYAVTSEVGGALAFHNVGAIIYLSQL